MATDTDVIEPDLGDVVDSAEADDDAMRKPFGRHVDIALIPADACVALEAFALRLPRRGHDDRSRRCGRQRARL